MAADGYKRPAVPAGCQPPACALRPVPSPRPAVPLDINQDYATPRGPPNCNWARLFRLSASRQAIDAGLEYLERKDYSRALAILEGAVERYPDDPEFILLWAQG